MENTDSDLKVHPLHCANKLLVRVRISFYRNFPKLAAQHAETIRKNAWEKSYDAYSLSVRVQTTINHISICFLPQYQRQRKCFLFRGRKERQLKKVLRDTSTRAALYVWDLVTFYDLYGFVLSMRMQVILGSLLTHPGSAPVWGGKKGEFRDWTILTLEKNYLSPNIPKNHQEVTYRKGACCVIFVIF